MIKSIKLLTWEWNIQEEQLLMKVILDGFLLMNMAKVCGLNPGTFVHTFGDVHIYSNHVEQMEEQLSRSPKPLPQMELNPEIKDIFDFKYEDFTLNGYDPHPSIRGKVAI